MNSLGTLALMAASLSMKTEEPQPYGRRAARGPKSKKCLRERAKKKAARKGRKKR